VTDLGGFVGRQTELRILYERLAAVKLGHPQVVFVEAEAGAGKSTFLSHFLASVSNPVTLSASGDEAESLLSYGVIDQLLDDTLTEPGTDPMAVGARLVDLLDQLQGGEKVVILTIDDLHWVDRSSLRAILFALRRLRADRVLTIVLARLGEMNDPGWDRFIGGDARVTCMRLEGLSVEEIIQLANAMGLGVLSRRGASRLEAHTEGNALYCHALLDEIGIAGLNGEFGGLPAPRQLSGVVLSRVASLSVPTQNFIEAAAVVGQHAPASTIASVAHQTDAQRQVEESVDSGLLNEGAIPLELSFAHPLYRAAIYGDLSPTTRRALHESAAKFTAGQAQLSHRIAASTGADEGLASELVESATASIALGELSVAAWALQQAASLSPIGDDRERRLLDAGLVLLNAADTTAAAQVLASCQVSSARRDALLGLLDVFTGSPGAEIRLLAAWTTHDPDTERLIGARAATSMANWMVITGRPDQALEWAQRAVDGTVPDSPLRSMARTAQAYGFAAGARSPEGLDVLSFLPVAGSEIAETDALIMRGMLKLYVDELPGSIVDLGLATARLRSGLPATYPGPCLSHLSDAHYRRGDWDAAVTFAQIAISRALDADRPLDLARAYARGAQVFAVRGEWSLAQAHADAAHDAAERFPAVLPVANAAVAAATLASARGEHAGVLLATEPLRATELLDVGGCPGMFNWRAFEVDALISLGRLDEAGDMIGEFSLAIPHSGLASAALSIARCRGNLAMARGDAQGAEAAFAEAHAMENQVLMPFEHGLTFLNDGQRLRAVKNIPAAVTQLEQAHAIFSALGADPYVTRCATELEALHVVASPESQGTRLGLSRAELAVARLVATGLTNREVANELYVSVKTVEYHLRNSYMKLNITSRRSLAALLN
jgi:DNA-binding CsgD family transcriptional regulator